MTPETRFQYRERVLADDEAYKTWCRRVYHAAARVKSAEEVLEDLREELKILQESDFPRTVTEQIELNPGDPGYDEAPVCFSPDLYHGQFKWVNTSTDDNDTP